MRVTGQLELGQVLKTPYFAKATELEWGGQGDFAFFPQWEQARSRAAEMAKFLKDILFSARKNFSRASARDKISRCAKKSPGARKVLSARGSLGAR